MATQRERTRCVERLARLDSSTLDRESLQREAIDDLRRVVGFDRWCWPVADPDTLVPLSGVAEHDYGPEVPRVLELEYSGGDFAAMDVIACRQHRPGPPQVGVEKVGIHSRRELLATFNASAR